MLAKAKGLDKRIHKFFFKLVAVLFLLIFNQQLVANPELEMDLFVPGDNIQIKNLTLNPASIQSTKKSIDLIGGRQYKKSILRDPQNLSTQDTNSKKEVIGIAGHSPLPDGLSLGGYHYRSYKESNSSSTDNGN